MCRNHRSRLLTILVTSMGLGYLDSFYIFIVTFYYYLFVLGSNTYLYKFFFSLIIFWTQVHRNGVAIQFHCKSLRDKWNKKKVFIVSQASLLIIMSHIYTGIFQPFSFLWVVPSFILTYEVVIMTLPVSELSLPTVELRGVCECPKPTTSIVITCNKYLCQENATMWDSISDIDWCRK